MTIQSVLAAIIAYRPEPRHEPEHDEATVEQVKTLFKRHHRDTCYPDASDGEADIFARAIIPIIRTTDAARIAALEAGLQKLVDLPIEENDGPNTLHLDGESYQGPVVDWTFKIIRTVKEVARATLRSNTDDR